MNRSCAELLAATLLSLAFATACFAQQDSASGSSAPAPVPAGVNNSASPQAPQEAKKVWTNGDLAGVSGNLPTSKTGKSNATARRTNPRYDSSENLVRSYRAQIEDLQKQIADVDKQIADLEAALSGQIVDEPRRYNPNGGRIGDWNAQVEQLQKKRQNLQGQIDNLETKIRQINP